MLFDEKNFVMQLIETVDCFSYVCTYTVVLFEYLSLLVIDVGAELRGRGLPRYSQVFI